MPHLSPNSVCIEYLAEVTDWKLVDSVDAALRLHGQHVWREEVIRERFHWGGSQSIYAMAVRVSRLPAPIDIPMRAQYGGCKSWVELDSIISTDGAQPVLTDREFEGKLQNFRAALEPAVVL